MSDPEGTALWVLNQLSSHFWQPQEEKGSSDAEEASGKKLMEESALKKCSALFLSLKEYLVAS